MIRTLAAFAFLALIGAIPVGCEQAQEAIDCQKICQNKRDCVDKDYDVEACRHDCEDRSDSSESFRQAAHTCQACIDDKACVEEISCFDDCPILK